MTLKKTMLALVALIAMVGLSSCNIDDPNQPITDVYTDIVTISRLDGAAPTFTYQRDGDSPLVTLSASENIPTNYREGERVVISYAPLNGLTQNESGAVRLLAIAPTEGLGQPLARSNAEKTGNWATGMVDMRGVWRTGPYLNLVFAVYTASPAKQCKVYLDENTIDDDYPRAYLIFEPSETGTPGNYMVYCSYSISEIWSKKSCKGIKVFYAGALQTDPVVIIKESGLQPGA